MTSSRKPDLSDLWQSMKRDNQPGPGHAVRTLCYVQQASGPVLTVITNQPIDIAELLASVAAPGAEIRS